MPKVAPTILFFALLLVGCGASLVTIEEPIASQAFLATIADLDSGLSRNEVHALLGEPFLTSEVSRIEIYRSEDEQVDVEVLMPVVVERSAVTSAILVLYDENWEVLAYGGDYDVEGQGDKEIDLQVMDYIMMKPLDEFGFSLISPRIPPSTLAENSAAQNSCMLRIIVPDPIRYHLSGLSLDGDMIFQFAGLFGGISSNPVRPTEDPMYVQFAVEPGKYSLSLVTFGIEEGAVSEQVVCESDNMLTAVIEVEVSHPAWQTKDFIMGEIRVFEGWPLRGGARRIILHLDQWFDE